MHAQTFAMGSGDPAPSDLGLARARVAQSVEAASLKGAALRSVWVRIPPRALKGEGSLQRTGQRALGLLLEPLGVAVGEADQPDRHADPDHAERDVGRRAEPL